MSLDIANFSKLQLDDVELPLDVVAVQGAPQGQVPVADGVGSFNWTTPATPITTGGATVILPDVGNIGATWSPTFGANQNVEASGVMNANLVLTVTGLQPGGQATFYLTQDGTGGRTLTVSNGQSTAAITLASTAAGALNVLTISTLDGVKLIIPPVQLAQTLNLAPIIWDGRNVAGAPVVYTAGQAPSGGVGSLVGYGPIQGGTTNPSVASTTPPGRVQTVAASTLIPAVGVARGGNCLRLTAYDTDVPPSVQPQGGSSHPSAAAYSPFILGGSQPSGPSTNSNVYFSGSFWMPGAGNSRGDVAFPIIPAGGGNFLQIMEMYGPPFTRSPSWQLDVISPSGAGGPNFLIIPSQLGPGYPSFWQSALAIPTECWNDWVFHVILDTQGSIDGTTHGLVEFWWGPSNTTANFGATLAQQTFRTSGSQTIGATFTNGSSAVTGLPTNLTFSVSPGYTYGFLTGDPGIPANTYLTVTGSGVGQLASASGPVAFTGASGARTGLSLKYFNTFNTGQTLGMVQPWNGSPQSVYNDLYRNTITGAVTIYHQPRMIATTFVAATPA